MWVLIVLIALLPAAGARARVKSIRLKYAQATLVAGKEAPMPFRVRPAADKKKVGWKSSDESVAIVSPQGSIRALSPGVVTITAYAADLSGASASCRLTVKPPAITRVVLSRARLTASRGDAPVKLTATVAPSAASAGALRWTSSNPRVATVSAGMVSFVGAGRANICAVAPGGKRAVCAVRVDAARAVRRGLVIGEGRADKAMGLAALPMVPYEAEDVAAMLTKNGIGTQTAVNVTRAKALSAIARAFAGAKSGDTSYLYITCHGGLSGGAYRLYVGGGTITPAQLRAVLDKVPGRVVLMLAACYSGTTINKGGQDDANEAFLGAFLGAAPKSGEFRASKYQVLCAARGSEKGYGVKTTDPEGTLVRSMTYNFFGKAVAEGGGGAADADKNGQITLRELHAYAYARVRALHDYWKDKIGLNASDVQTVVAYPANSDFALFG